MQQKQEKTIVVQSDIEKAQEVIQELLDEAQERVVREQAFDTLSEAWCLTGGPPLTHASHAVTNRANNADGSKLQRNDPCPCDSGKKFKKCCRELIN